MVKIYALRGSSNTGKSTILKLLPDMLLNKYKSARVIHPYMRSNQFQDIVYVLGGVKKNLKVGISSGGDTPWDVERWLDKLFEMEPDLDIIFCACRTGEGAMNTLGNYPTKNNATRRKCDITIVDVRFPKLYVKQQQRREDTERAEFLMTTAGL